MLAATLIDNSGTVRVLIEKGANVNDKDDFGFTPLINIAPFNDVEMVRLLLARGADVNATTGKDSIKILLDAGAKVNVQERRGMSPLMLAIATDHTSPAVVRMLVEHGADTNVKSNLGETAADWGRKFKAPSVVAAASVQPAMAEERRTAKAAIDRSLTLLERVSGGFMKTGTERRAGERAQRARGPHGSKREGGRARLGWVRAGCHAPGRSSRRRRSTRVQPACSSRFPAGPTDFLVHFIAAKQHPSGEWADVGACPPMQDVRWRCTRLLGANGNSKNGCGARRRGFPRRNRGRRRTALQMLGLHWAHASQSTVQRRRKDLVALQRADGGRAQTPELYAFHELGAPVDNRGVEFLLRTQATDGSWHVRIRAPKLQPYFQSGFPYDHDQWISMAATAWATAALAPAVPAKQIAQSR